MGESKHVIVALGEELYGIPVLSVETILRDPKPVRMPKSPKMLLGVFELRGRTLASIDLRLRLELPEHAGDSNHVVVNTPVGPVSLRVDSVVGIASIEEDSIEPTTTLVNHESDEFLSGVAKHLGKLVALLNPEHIVPTKLKNTIAKVA